MGSVFFPYVSLCPFGSIILAMSVYICIYIHWYPLFLMRRSIFDPSGPWWIDILQGEASPSISWSIKPVNYNELWLRVAWKHQLSPLKQVLSQFRQVWGTTMSRTLGGGSQCQRLRWFVRKDVALDWKVVPRVVSKTPASCFTTPISSCFTGKRGPRLINYNKYLNRVCGR